ncbi:hypothetical protein NPIL_476231 [Nephila pilipes]|uniref:DUF5641 domain-containing protein n=1 Tax=Nephila pilipes TaxID=299642 RepID=A0A8X6QAX6_NEPPI|nr:hypothetical protein NPIL_476231 [Nephila pilipes]
MRSSRFNFNTHDPKVKLQVKAYVLEKLTVPLTGKNYFNIHQHEALRSIANMKSDFWKKWCSDFFSFRQPCKECQEVQQNAKKDDIVLVKVEGPPGSWLIVRILEVLPGNYELIRVASMKPRTPFTIVKL